jgi:Concanavalin A-like lectin/glucanases superfamily
MGKVSSMTNGSSQEAVLMKRLKAMRTWIATAAASASLVGIAVPAHAATPVALWHMDDSPGSQMIDSAGSNNGTLIGAVVQGMPGVSGTAYSFEGSPALVNVPDSDSLDPGTAPITLTADVNLTVAPAPQKDYDLIRKGLGSTGADYKMEIKTVNGLPQALCLFQGTGGNVLRKSGSRTPPLTDGRWHSLKCVKTDTYVQVFIDGVSFGKNSHAAGSISNSDDLLVGARTPSGGDQYQGLMDNVQIDIGA